MAPMDAAGGAATSTVTGNTPADEATGSQPMLLGIPQELRDEIFALVFEPSYTGDGIGLVWKSGGLDQESTYLDVLEQELPPKDPLLTCRQISSEQASRHAALRRAHWTQNAFVIGVNALYPFRDPVDLARAVSADQEEIAYQASIATRPLVAEEDLKHIHCFAFRMTVLEEHYSLNFFFIDGVWDVAIALPEAQGEPGLCTQRLLRRDDGSAPLPRTLRELNASVNGVVIRNPAVGCGFGTFRLIEFAKLLRYRFLMWQR